MSLFIVATIAAIVWIMSLVVMFVYTGIVLILEKKSNINLDRMYTLPSITLLCVALVSGSLCIIFAALGILTELLIS